MIISFFSLPVVRFQCIQASDYDETKLVTGENLVRHRKKKFAHLSLKHITLLGIVRMKVKKKKKKKKKVTARSLLTSSKPVSGRSAFLFDEAEVNANDDEDDDDNDDDEDEDNREEEDYETFSPPERGMSESEFDSDSESGADEDEEEPGTESGDISEQLVRSGEAVSRSGSSSNSSSRRSTCSSADIIEAAYSDHTYSCVRKFGGRDAGKELKKATSSREWQKRAKYRYSFLYSISVSGVTKAIKNCIPKAVAILSNSKTIILGHVQIMLECLDPALAELCYMDTDSCIFSFTHPLLDDNLLPEKKEFWSAANILADEAAPESCHGKLKLEGTFRVGFFKALKIYRLFSSREFEREKKEKICYTRCKGVNRNIAKIIPNDIFARDSVEKTVIHRSCLRPSRTGEMLIAHECKSLAAPFNLKRYVADDGLHSFPVSYVPDEDGGGGGEEGLSLERHGEIGEAL